jgi:hypothetical protein
MNISSLFNGGSSIWIQNTKKTSSTSGASSTTSGTAFLQALSSMDGDTFQLSSSSSLGNSPFMTYNGSGSVNATSNIKSDIQDFMSKLSNGTATDADLQNIENAMKAIQSANSTAAASSTNNSSDLRTDFKDFMDKLKNGTATDSDLQNIETELKQVPATQSTDSSNTSTNSSSSFALHPSDFNVFMDKLKNGTATDSDLQNIETELKPGGELNPIASTQNADNSNTSSSSDLHTDVKNFMAKLINGTATDSDLQNIENELKQVTATQTTNSTNASSNGSDLRNDLKDFMTKLKNGTATDSDLQNIENELKQVTATQNSDSSNSSGSTTNNGSGLHTELRDFMAKLKNGSATDADLQQIQTELQQANGTQNITASTSLGSSLQADLENFLTTIKNGTATDTDLKKMEAELSQIQI